MDNSPSDRKRSIDNLFFNQAASWKTTFWWMLLLSTGIATLGLSENSAAAVIGAMIVAPLGQPIVTFGATIAAGWYLRFAL